jgi:hypothetical protein
MVQFFKGSEDPRDKAYGNLAGALGMGIGNGLNTYFANRSLQSVLQDKSLKDAPQSEKMQRLHSALSPYGQNGQEALQYQMQIGQQEQQEKETKKQEAIQKQKGKALGRYLNGGELDPEEQALFTPQEFVAMYKAKNPEQKSQIEKEKRLFKHQKELQEQKDIAAKERAGMKALPMGERPVPEDQINAMKRAHATPGYEKMTESQKYQTLIDNKVSAQNAIKEATLQSQQAQREDQKVESAYKAQQPFIDEVTQSYKGFETEMKPRLLQMQHMKPEDIISPTAAAFLEALHIPLGALEDPSSELYNKLSQDLLKGLPETYGSRILKVEVENFLKTIPTLLNSADGRRMIASNMLKLGEMKEIYYNAMRDKQREYLDENRPLPRDFQQVVFDQVKPQIDRINNEFIQLSEIKSVPEATIPFFGPDGQIKFVPKEHAEWATQNGGRKIW